MKSRSIKIQVLFTIEETYNRTLQKKIHVDQKVFKNWATPTFLQNYTTQEEINI